MLAPPSSHRSLPDVAKPRKLGKKSIGKKGKTFEDSAGSMIYLTDSDDDIDSEVELERQSSFNQGTLESLLHAPVTATERRGEKLELERTKRKTLINVFLGRKVGHDNSEKKLTDAPPVLHTDDILSVVASLHGDSKQKNFRDESDTESICDDEFDPAQMSPSSVPLSPDARNSGRSNSSRNTQNSNENTQKRRNARKHRSYHGPSRKQSESNLPVKSYHGESRQRSSTGSQGRTHRLSRSEHGPIDEKNSSSTSGRRTPKEPRRKLSSSKRPQRKLSNDPSRKQRSSTQQTQHHEQPQVRRSLDSQRDNLSSPTQLRRKLSTNPHATPSSGEGIQKPRRISLRDRNISPKTSPTPDTPGSRRSVYPSRSPKRNPGYLRVNHAGVVDTDELPPPPMTSPRTVAMNKTRTFRKSHRHLLRELDSSNLQDEIASGDVRRSLTDTDRRSRRSLLDESDDSGRRSRMSSSASNRRSISHSPKRPGIRKSMVLTDKSIEDAMKLPDKHFDDNDKGEQSMARSSPRMRRKSLTSNRVRSQSPRPRKSKSAESVGRTPRGGKKVLSQAAAEIADEQSDARKRVQSDKPLKRMASSPSILAPTPTDNAGLFVSPRRSRKSINVMSKSNEPKSLIRRLGRKPASQTMVNPKLHVGQPKPVPNSPKQDGPQARGFSNRLEGMLGEQRRATKMGLMKRFKSTRNILAVDD